MPPASPYPHLIVIFLMQVFRQHLQKFKCTKLNCKILTNGHLCKTHITLRHTIFLFRQKGLFPVKPLLPISSPRQPVSIFFQQRLVLPLLQFHINEIIQHLPFNVCFLSQSLMTMRFIHVIVCINSSLLFIGEQYSIVCT